MIKKFLLSTSLAIVGTINGLNINNTAPKTDFAQFFVEQGDIFTITVTSNAGTGASWNVQPFDKKRVEFIDTTRTFTNPSMPGSQIYEHYNFRALKTGRATIIMKYGRPWENTPWEINTYTITIKQKG